MKSCISLFAAYTMLLTRATFIERKHKACDVSHEGMHSRVKLTDAKTMIEVVIADAALMLSWELLNVLSSMKMDGVAVTVGDDVGKSNVRASIDDPGQH